MAKNFRIRGNPGNDLKRSMDGRGRLIYTEEEIRAINEAQGRHRISGEEAEGMMALIAATNILTPCVDTLADHARRSACLKWLRMGKTLIRKAVVMMNGKLDVRQMNAIASQMIDATISVSANPLPPMINIALEDMLHICNRALETCEMVCSCTREESKHCRLRAALDCVPGAKEQAKERARADASKCPYKGIEMEVEE